MKASNLRILYLGNSPEMVKTLLGSRRTKKMWIFTQKVSGIYQRKRRGQLLVLSRKNRFPTVIIDHTWTKNKLFKRLRKVIEKLDPDLVLVSEFYWIIPKEIIYLCKNKIFNIHKSLLPKGRSRHPIQWVVISGEKYTGVTVHEVVATVDAGRIALQTKFKIEAEDTYQSIKIKLDITAINLLRQLLNNWPIKTTDLKNQNESIATFWPPRTPIDSLINWHKTAKEIHNLIRVSWSDYTAYTYFDGERVEICRGARFEEINVNKPGSVVFISHDGFVVSTRRGGLLVMEYRYQNKINNVELLKKLKVDDILG